VEVEPLFSVVIPTCNRAALLPGAVDSVLAQRWRHWELIIVDDGSTDTTPEVGAAYAARDARIRYLRQPNRQLNGARLAGIAVARGQWLCFLDDDDEWLPEHLAALAAAAATAYGPALLKTRMWIRYPGQLQPAAGYDPGLHPAAAMWANLPNLLSFAFHRRIFDEITFDERFLLFDDGHFLLRVLPRYPLVYVDADTVVYRVHEGSRSYQYWQPCRLQNHLAAIDDAFGQAGPELLQHTGTGAQRALKAKACYHFARAAALGGAPGLGWRYLRQALGYGFRPRAAAQTALALLRRW